MLFAKQKKVIFLLAQMPEGALRFLHKCLLSICSVPGPMLSAEN